MTGSAYTYSALQFSNCCACLHRRAHGNGTFVLPIGYRRLATVGYFQLNLLYVLCVSMFPFELLGFVIQWWKHTRGLWFDQKGHITFHRRGVQLRDPNDAQAVIAVELLYRVHKKDQKRRSGKLSRGRVAQF